MKLHFLGAAGTVTGSKTLVEVQGSKPKPHYVLVDCGLFQGLKALRLQNRERLTFDSGDSRNSGDIESVVLTHAHLDHSGYLPLLVNQGFRGRIYCTSPTRDLVALVLRDAAHLQEEDADFANKKGFSKHHPAKPLFTVQDVERVIDRIETVREEKEFFPCPGLSARFKKNGHILGSCVVVLNSEEQTLTFSGDMGRKVPLIYPNPRPLEDTDYLVLESTYGDRIHIDTPENAAVELRNTVCETFSRGGQLIIPSFAIGRTQEVLHLLAELKNKNQIPEVPIFLDTPMGISATEIFVSHPGWHRLTPDLVERLLGVAKIVKSQEESIKIMRDTAPKIIIAGSGMAAGGRVLHHLSHRLPDSKNTVLFTGFQAVGTRGRDLIEGAPHVKIHGQMIPVNAQIKMLSSLSGHADQSELLEWLETCPGQVKRVFIQHGEPIASKALASKIHEKFAWETTVPDLGQSVIL